jgi:hypothetical protein
MSSSFFRRTYDGLVTPTLAFSDLSWAYEISQRAEGVFRLLPGGQKGPV